MRSLRGCGLVIILMSCLFAVVGYAATIKPLQPNQAFQFSYEVTSPSTVIAKWKMAPGYFLYRDRFQFASPSAAKLTITYPATNFISNKNVGSHAGYTGELAIPVTASTNGVTLRVNYQGCSDQGFCYPPMTQTIVLGTAEAAPAPTSSGLTGLMNDQEKINQLLMTPHPSLLLLIFVGLGLLLSFTPCVLPMVPILTSIIIGQRGPVSTRKAFFLSGSYVMGTSLTYASAGVAAAMMGSSLQVWLQQPFFIYVGTGLFVLLALSLFGVFEFKMPSTIRNQIVEMSNRQRGGAYAGVFLMGVLSALLVSPCVTAPLVGVLMYIASTGDVLLGAGALFALGIGMGIPLMVVGISAGKWLPKRGPWMDAVSKFFGLIMLGMAIWLLSRVLSFSVAALLYGIVLMLGSVIIAVYLPRHIGWKQLHRSLGAMTAVTGALFIFSAFNPSSFVGDHQPVNVNQNSFMVVHNQEQLDQALLAARAQKKPVLIDFYADWCESCVAMEKEVFDTALVQARLKHFALVRVDLTENSAEDQMLLTNYKVIAPPTVLLFNQSGHEDDKLRMIGEMPATEFLSRIEVFAQKHCEKNSVC